MVLQNQPSGSHRCLAWGIFQSLGVERILRGLSRRAASVYPPDHIQEGTESKGKQMALNLGPLHTKESSISLLRSAEGLGLWLDVGNPCSVYQFLIS